MAKRIFSTVALWTVVLVSLWLFGAPAAVVLLTLLAALTLHEVYELAEKMGAKPFHWMGLVFSVLLTAGPYSLIFLGNDLHGYAIFAGLLLIMMLLAAALIFSCFRILRERDGTNRIGTLTATIAGLVYAPFMLQFLVLTLLLGGDDNSYLGVCLWIVAVSKFCDVGALLTGLAIGRHKMAPIISPKKTWEGAVGGVLVSAGIGAAIAYFASAHLPEFLTPLAAALIAAPLAIVTIVSDLIESVLKRWADSKDSGHLIPGIGGALDLTDSLILTAPVAFFIFLFLQ